MSHFFKTGMHRTCLWHVSPLSETDRWWSPAGHRPWILVYVHLSRLLSGTRCTGSPPETDTAAQAEYGQNGGARVGSQPSRKTADHHSSNDMVHRALEQRCCCLPQLAIGHPSGTVLSVVTLNKSMPSLRSSQLGLFEGPQFAARVSCSHEHW